MIANGPAHPVTFVARQGWGDVMMVVALNKVIVGFISWVYYRSDIELVQFYFLVLKQGKVASAKSGTDSAHRGWVGGFPANI